MIPDPRPRNGVAAYGRRLLPAAALEHAPAEVTTANTAAAEALERHGKLTTSAREAEAAARNAVGVDREAAKTALSEGKQPPKPTVDAKRVEAAQAARLLEAAEQLADEAFAGLAAAVAAHHRDWADAVAPVLVAAADRAQGAAQALQAEFADADQASSVIAYLRGFDLERAKTQELRPAAPRLLTTGDPVDRHPAALLDALADAAGSYRTLLDSAPSVLEQREADRARNRADREAQAERHHERRAKTPTVPGFTLTR